MDPANQNFVSLRVGFSRGSVLRHALLRIALVVCGAVCMLALARIAWFIANPVALAMVTIGELALALALGVFPALALVAWRLQTKHFATDLADDPAHEPYPLEQLVERPALREAAKQASCFELGPRLAGLGLTPPKKPRCPRCRSNTNQCPWCQCPWRTCRHPHQYRHQHDRMAMLFIWGPKAPSEPQTAKPRSRQSGSPHAHPIAP